jgi:hypothetical protein
MMPGVCRACRVRVWWDGWFWTTKMRKAHICRKAGAA